MRTAEPEPGNAAAIVRALRHYICTSREGWDLLAVPLLGAERSADVRHDLSSRPG